ncbi:MAG TPA: hypothetical protein VMU06_20775 [Stellaceae bacterium]|nr:hypothetical protein [Stellaceae bacterium]
MPLVYQLLDEGRRVAFTASGRLSGSELVEINRQALSRDLRATPLVYAFFDFDDVTEVAISTAELPDVADMGIKASRQMPKGTAVAIYAKDDLPFALARIWQVFVDQTGWETAVFRARPEAVVWLQSRVAVKFGIQAVVE